MKKIIAFQILFIALFAGLMVLLLNQNKAVHLSMDKCQTILEKIAEDDGLKEAGDMQIRRAFGTNLSEYGDYIYMTTSDTMTVDEVLLVEADPEYHEAIMDAMNTRLDAQKEAFDGYGTDQMEILSKAIIRESGNYVWFIVSKDADEWQQQILTKGVE